MPQLEGTSEQRDVMRMSRSFTIAESEFYLNKMGSKVFIEQYTRNCIREICWDCMFNGCFIEGLQKGYITTDPEPDKRWVRYTVSLNLVVRKVTRPLSREEMDGYAIRAAESIFYELSRYRTTYGLSTLKTLTKSLEEIKKLLYEDDITSQSASKKTSTRPKKTMQYKIIQRPKSCSKTSC